jgi:hypothetical protein
MGLFAVDFRGTARNWWVYWSVIGHRLKVGATDPEGQGAGAVQMVWTRVEMWERGTPNGDGAAKENLVWRSSLHRSYRRSMRKTLQCKRLDWGFRES